MRQMATVRMISDVSPIENADAIEVATVDGWKVVIRKGEYNEGQIIVFCEIDSWIPIDLAPFLSKGKEPRTYEGVKGERLRTIKLRGQISQGLILSTELLTDFWDIGDDVSEILNIAKYDPPVNAQLAGMAKGNFPPQIRKTDQERIQNCMSHVANYLTSPESWEITEKLEGSSMTCYLIDGEFGVCSRNLDLKETEGNGFWECARRLDIETKMRNCGFIDGRYWDNIAIQGELIGPGIQKNIYKLDKTQFKVFDIFDIQTQRYLTPDARFEFKRVGIDSVPVLYYTPLSVRYTTASDIIKDADGMSILNSTNREGLVFKSHDGQKSFKAISNKYLLKEK